MWQILEQVLLAPKKTRLHDDVVAVLALHTSPLVPLPRVRMLAVSAKLSEISIRLFQLQVRSMMIVRACVCLETWASL